MSTGTLSSPHQVDAGGQRRWPGARRARRGEARLVLAQRGGVRVELLPLLRTDAPAQRGQIASRVIEHRFSQREPPRGRLRRIVAVFGKQHGVQAVGVDARRQLLGGSGVAKRSAVAVLGRDVGGEHADVQRRKPHLWGERDAQGLVDGAASGETVLRRAHRCDAGPEAAEAAIMLVAWSRRLVGDASNEDRLGS